MLRKIYLLLIAISALFLTGCGSSGSGDEAGCYQKGYAAFYTFEENGTLTSYNEHYERSRLTAAHHNLPYGTRVKVTNLSNGRSTIVTINDRNMPDGDYIIKLSEKAAPELAASKEKPTEVSLDIVKWG